LPSVTSLAVCEALCSELEVTFAWSATFFGAAVSGAARIARIAKAHMNRSIVFIVSFPKRSLQFNFP